jgi:hypothetical protein
MAFMIPVMAWAAANAGTIAVATSAAVAAAGAIRAGQAQSASYKSAAAAARYNAQAEMQNATTAQQAASANEMALRRQNDARMGAMRAEAAESGGYTGTNLELLDQSATRMELDALNTRYRGQGQATGMLAQANLDAYQARVDRMNASSAVTAGYYGAASQVLGAASNYYNFRSLYYDSGSSGYGYVSPSGIDYSYRG